MRRVEGSRRRRHQMYEQLEVSWRDPAQVPFEWVGPVRETKIKNLERNKKFVSFAVRILSTWHGSR